MILFPYLIWLDLGGGTSLISFAQVVQNLRTWAWMLAALLVAHLGLDILVLLGRGAIIPSRSKPPEVMREPVDPGARVFVYFFALAPVLAMALFSFLSPRPENFMAAPLAVMSGLAVIVAAGDRIRIEHQYVIGYAWAALMILPPVLVALAIVIQPWIFAVDLRVGRPAKDIGQFFAESFQRRTGKPLGDRRRRSADRGADFARPRRRGRASIWNSAPEYLPKVTKREIEEKGAVVVWPAADTTGRPPRRNPPPVSRSGGRGAAHVLAALPGPHAADAARLGHDPAARAGCVPELPPARRWSRSPRRRPSRNGRCRSFRKRRRKARRKRSSPPRRLPLPRQPPRAREPSFRQPRTLPQLERHAPQ